MNDPQNPTDNAGDRLNEAVGQLNQIHTVARDIAIWVITGVCAFLGYNVWQVSLSVERLVGELKHTRESEIENTKRMDRVQEIVYEIKNEQAKRTGLVYSVEMLGSRLTRVEDQLLKREDQ